MRFRRKRRFGRRSFRGGGFKRRGKKSFGKRRGGAGRLRIGHRF